MQLANVYADEIINALIDGDRQISVHTADPGLAGTSEITGGYRATLTQASDWAAISTIAPAGFTAARVVTNANDEEFSAVADATQTVTHFTVWDVSGTPTIMFSEALANPQQLTAGNPIRFPAGSFTFGFITNDATP